MELRSLISRDSLIREAAGSRLMAATRDRLGKKLAEIVFTERMD